MFTKCLLINLPADYYENTSSQAFALVNKKTSNTLYVGWLWSQVIRFTIILNALFVFITYNVHPPVKISCINGMKHLQAISEII